VAERSAELHAFFAAHVRWEKLYEDLEPFAVCTECDRLLDILSGDNDTCECGWHAEYIARAQVEDGYV
jgi:hypothetical protein